MPTSSRTPSPMSHVSKLLLLLVGLSGLPASAAKADVDLPPWLQPDVLAAALDMQLDAAQQSQFQAALTETINALIKRTRRLVRANNTTHLERRIRTAARRQFNKLDDTVATFLNAEQQARYQVYRQRLLAHLSGRSLLNPRPAQGAGDTGALGTHNPDWH